MEQPDSAGEAPAVVIENEAGSSGFVLLCDHASNHVPPVFRALGLDHEALRSHIAWDPGALEVARCMSQMLDAPLVRATISRLVIDCNRPVDAPDAIPEMSETTHVPGNCNLDEQQRQQRIALSHAPYHQAIEALLDRRAASSALIAVHTYTPVYKGIARPWPVGVIFNRDQRLSGPLIEHLSQIGLNVGVNEPYSPQDRVYYTLERHGEARGLASVMVEIRNDEVAQSATQELWAKRICDGLRLGEAPALGAPAVRSA